MATLTLTRDEAIALRLEGQGLVSPAPARAFVRTAGRMAWVQAQVGSAARYALAARSDGLRPGAVEHALVRSRTLVKTWAVRGTLHLLPAADLPLFVAAFGAYRARNVDHWMAQEGLDAATCGRLAEDIVEALAEGPLTRRGIAARVGDRHGARARRMIEHSWGGVIKRTLYEGRACFGPARGAEVTFMRTDRWLPARAAAALAAAAPGRVSAEQVAAAEAAVVRRYVDAYAPATARDFAFWAGIYVPDALRIWARIADELVPVEVEGRTRFVRAGSARAVRVRARRALERAGTGAGAGDGAGHVRLLAHFDPYLLGHRDKSEVVDPARHKSVFRTAGWIAPVVLRDGRVAGTWEFERRSGRLTARTRGLGRVPAAVREGMRAGLARLASIDGDALRLSVR
jgi:hypothetical protein